MSEAATIEKAAEVFEKPDDRTLIKKEAQADPRFAKLVARMLRGHDGEENVANFAKQAVLNELNPSQFPETKGYWTLLRKSVRMVTDELSKAVAATVNRMTPAQLAAAYKAAQGAATPGFDRKMLGDLGDLGQFEIIASVVGSLAQAGAAVYGSYLQNRTQQQLSNLQFQTQQAQLAAQMDMARAQQAVTAAQAAQAAEASILPPALQQPVQAVAAALTSDVGGLPLWLVALGVIFALKFGKWA